MDCEANCWRTAVPVSTGAYALIPVPTRGNIKFIAKFCWVDYYVAAKLSSQFINQIMQPRSRFWVYLPVARHSLSIRVFRLITLYLQWLWRYFSEQRVMAGCYLFGYDNLNMCRSLLLWHTPLDVIGRLLIACRVYLVQTDEYPEKA